MQVEFISGGLCGSNRFWEKVGKSRQEDFPREQQWSDVEKVVSFKSLHQN